MRSMRPFPDRLRGSLQLLDGAIGDGLRDRQPVTEPVNTGVNRFGRVWRGKKVVDHATIISWVDHLCDWGVDLKRGLSPLEGEWRPNRAGTGHSLQHQPKAAVDHFRPSDECLLLDHQYWRSRFGTSLQGKSGVPPQGLMPPARSPAKAETGHARSVNRARSAIEVTPYLDNHCA